MILRHFSALAALCLCSCLSQTALAARQQTDSTACRSQNRGGHNHHRRHHHRRRAGRGGLEHRAEDRRPDSATAASPASRPPSAPTSRCCTTRTTSTSASSPTTPSRERVIGTQMARDASLGSDDRIEILLDTFRDQRSAFYFATNPVGRAGRRPGVRQRPVEHRMGCDLERAHQTHRAGLDRGVRDSVQEPELSRRRRRCGASTSPATSIESSRTPAGPARASRRSSSRCRRRARSRISRG